MSLQYDKVVSFILLEQFGPVVEKVATFLSKNRDVSLRAIHHGTQLPFSKVQKAILTLIKYRLVSFDKIESVTRYSFIHRRTLLKIRYPKYINYVKRRFGDEAEMIVEEVLLRSCWSASELILNVADKLPSVPISRIRERFQVLVSAQYLERVMVMPVKISDWDSLDPNLIRAKFTPPVLDVKSLMAIKDKPESQRRQDLEMLPDSNIYWVVNFERFHQDMRDKLIVSSFSQRFDDNAGEFIRIFLQQMYIRTKPWAETSNPIPLVEIREIVKKQSTHQPLVQFFDQYVAILEQDKSLTFMKYGDAGGRSFQIYLRRLFTEFAWEIVEQAVLEKFDTKTVRIFRLVKENRFISPEDIQRVAMLSQKEAKMLTYALLDEEFLRVKDVKKSASMIQKSFLLFYIDLTHAVHVVLEKCYQTLFNVMIRRNTEKTNNSRILDKKHKVDTILLGMRANNSTEEQIADIEDMISPTERDLIQKVEETLQKLSTVELEVDETVFLLKMYLTYEEAANRKEKREIEDPDL